MNSTSVTDNPAKIGAVSGSATGSAPGSASGGVNPNGRAEISVDGVVYPLRLTLGGLADLEAALGGVDFAGLKTRLAAPRAADLLTILHVLMTGGGASMSLAALKASDLDLADAAKAIAKAFAGLNAAASGAGGQDQTSAHDTPQTDNDHDKDYRQSDQGEAAFEGRQGAPGKP